MVIPRYSHTAQKYGLNMPESNDIEKGHKEYCKYVLKVTYYTAQQKFSTDFIFVLILVRIRNDFFEVINKYGNPFIYVFFVSARHSKDNLVRRQ